MDYKLFVTTMVYQSAKSDNVKKIEELYSASLSSELACIVSNLGETIFFDGDMFLRLLEFQEVLDAEADMNVDFIEKGIVPIFDLGDNDYLSFDLNKQMWCKFNIVDELCFSYKAKLLDYSFE